MNVLGVCGGTAAITDRSELQVLGLMHDASAALVCDGSVVAAVEQERLDRVKHSFAFPREAIYRTLQLGVAAADDIHHVAIAFDESFIDAALMVQFSRDQKISELLSARRLYSSLLSKCGLSVGQERPLHFVPHHIAHAESAFSLSGLSESIVISIDGRGEYNAGIIALIDPAGLTVLREIPLAASLGAFYHEVTRFLGFSLFDEYKVMGLASYGSSDRYRSLFDTFFTLSSSAEFSISRSVTRMLRSICLPRRPRQPVESVHRDIAASLQRVLETIVVHMAKWAFEETKTANLCVVGGVAQNCVMNGVLAGTGIFRRIFVPSVPHDAGTALGAALHVAKHIGDRVSPPATPYLGTNIPENDAIAEELKRWGNVIHYTHSSQVAKDTAAFLNKGFVAGWLQGRSEYGPRALGNRSILADPRRRDMRDRINKIIKRRDDFRPLSPSVTADALHQFFCVPQTKANFDIMAFTLPVRAERQSELAAITHIDGTARVHAVSEEINPRFARLLNEWEKLTEIPVLLNTSFNNEYEPMVDSIVDAISCFLSTELDVLILGDYIVHKLTCDLFNILPLLNVRLNENAKAISETVQNCAGQARTKHFVQWAYRLPGATILPTDDAVEISPFTMTLIRESNVTDALGMLMDVVCVPKNERKVCVNQIADLWRRRLILVQPSVDTRDGS